MAISNILKKFDAYPKIEIEVNKTFSGALCKKFIFVSFFILRVTKVQLLFLILVTICATVVMGFLILSELNAYLTPNVTEELFVDTTRNHKLKINLDFLIPQISCDYLSLDAQDSTGEQHLHIEHNIYKRRISLEGHPIEEPKKEDIQQTTKKMNVVSKSRYSTKYILIVFN